MKILSFGGMKGKLESFGKIIGVLEMTIEGIYNTHNVDPGNAYLFIKQLRIATQQAKEQFSTDYRKGRLIDVRV